MSTILVTSCSNRKTVPPENRLQASALPQASLQEIGSIWRGWLKDHHCRLKAGDMYNGRGAAESKLAAKTANASQWFVSAGLGLVSATENVPGYDLTVSGNGPNQIRTRIKGSLFDSQAWWHELAKRRRPHRTLSRLIEDSNASLVVLALPSNYLRMILGDLSALNAANLKRLRIIGPPKLVVPAYLQSIWLPYDARLDGAESPIPGTRSDFPQRAARHFFEVVWPSTRVAKTHIHVQAVADALSDLPYPIVPRRKQLDDVNIQKAIQKLWLRAEGKSSRMLRILRDEENIACEQSRFKNLFNKVKQELSGIS